MYNNNYNYNPNWYQPPGPQPGKHEATVAMVLGIVSCALLIFGYTALGSIVTGIIGLIYASRAKSLGFNGTPRTVGYGLLAHRAHPRRARVPGHRVARRVVDRHVHCPDRAWPCPM
mgnify:CR=1 FL=1